MGGRPGRRAAGAAADPQRQGRGAARPSCPTARCCSPRRVPTRTAEDDDEPRTRCCGCCPRTAARPASWRPVAGGVDGVQVAADAGTVVLSAEDVPVLGERRRGGARSARSARRRRSPRSCTRACRCGSGTTTSGPARRGSSPARWPTTDAGADPRIELSDLTPDAGTALASAWQYDVSPDGSTIVTTWARARARGRARSALALVDVATGDRRILLDDAESEYESPRFSPDGQSVAVVREKRSTPEEPGRPHGRGRLARRRDRPRPERRLGPLAAGPLEWTPDGAALVLVADENGRAPVFRIDARVRRGHPADGRRRRLLRRAGLARRPARLRDAHVVRRAAAPGAPRRDHCRPGARRRCVARTRRPCCPARLTEVETTAEDGARVRAWLALPDGASAARPGAAAAVDPRRPARLVERLVLALEPVARRRPGVRRAAARPGAVHRLRPGLHPPRLGQLGRRAVHRPDGDHRRGRRARRHRRDPHRRDGRLVRRLHGQLGRRAHRPVPGDRHAREPVGARPVRRRRPTLRATGRAR